MEQAGARRRDDDAHESGPLFAALDELVSAANEASTPDLIRLAKRYGKLSAVDQHDLDTTLDTLLDRLRQADVIPRGAVLGAVAAGHARRVGGQARGGGRLSSHEARLAALYRINRAATASLALDEMLQTVVGVVQETMASDSTSIFLFDPASNTLILRASVGLHSEADGRVTLPMGAGITGEAAVRRQILDVPDAQHHPKYLDYPTLGDHGYASQVSAPLALRSPNRLVGVLNILTAERREFEDDELAFLETAAGEIAIAIENARLYSETDAQLRQRISQLATLQNVSRLVASTLDLTDLLRLISKQTVELADAAAAEIYRLPRGRPGELELLARSPQEGIEGLQEIQAHVRALVDDVIKSGASIWRRFGGSTGLVVFGVPMLTGRRAVGAICVFHRTRPVDHQGYEGLLGAFSDSAAIAIENAELYDEARRGYTRASTLLLEMHHRVRNNLQTVAALLSMQARHAGDDALTKPLLEAVSRVQSIAAIHDVLSGGNLRMATVDMIAKHVVDEASITVVPPDMQIDFEIPATDVRVSSKQATVLALLINEFIANAVRHGLAGRDRGRIQIRTWSQEEMAFLELSDDGVGVGPDFDINQSAGLGLQIARTLAQVDLRGTLDLQQRPEGGTVVRLTFALNQGQDTD